MTNQLPEEGEQAGPVLDVRIEGSVTDGVFRIDAGVENVAMITLHYNEVGEDVVSQLLVIVTDNWEMVHKQIVAAREEALAAVQAEETK